MLIPLVKSILKTSMQKLKRSEIYSVGNFDLKFNAKQALGCKRELLNQYWFLLYTRLLNIHCDS